MRGPTSGANGPRDGIASGPACIARETVRRERLLRDARRGDGAAREQIVTANLGLVRSLASRYRDLGVPFDDLVQEGAVGLLDAIAQYDPERGLSFETYARFRIRRAIRNALTEQARLIRLPKQVVERRRAIERAEARLSASTAGRTPTPEQVAAVTGLSVADVVSARAAGIPPVSLDEPVRPDGSSLATVLADEGAADPELEAIEHERTTLLRAAIAELPERQRQIVVRRWGVGPDSPPDGEPGPELSLSPRRRQTIGRDALYHLRGALRPVRSRA